MSETTEQLIKQIGELEGLIAKGEMDLPRCERYLAKTYRGQWVGLAMVCGAILIVVLMGSELLCFAVSIVLFVWGIAAFFVNVFNERKAKRMVNMTEERLVMNRKKIAECKARLSIPQ